MSTALRLGNGAVASALVLQHEDKIVAGAKSVSVVVAEELALAVDHGAVLRLGLGQLASGMQDEGKGMASD